jgi:hypothetical protein
VDPEKLKDVPDDFQAVQMLFQEYPGLKDIFYRCVGQRFTELVSSCCIKFCNQRWFDLAQRPQDFDREFNKITCELRGYLKKVLWNKGSPPNKEFRARPENLEDGIFT